MATLEPGRDGVKVYTNSGVFLGTARAHGHSLTSEGALAQLGFKEDEHGELVGISPDERLRALGVTQGDAPADAPATVAAPKPAAAPRKPAAKK